MSRHNNEWRRAEHFGPICTYMVFTAISGSSSSFWFFSQITFLCAGPFGLGHRACTCPMIDQAHAPDPRGRTEEVERGGMKKKKKNNKKIKKNKEEE